MRTQRSSRSILPPCPQPYPKKQISFNNTVCVQAIPSRHEYSERVKSSYWSSAEELYWMSKRNVFEFRAEGWDWREVVEDDQFLFFNGEKVHPSHFSYFDSEMDQKECTFSKIRHRDRNETWTALPLTNNGAERSGPCPDDCTF